MALKKLLTFLGIISLLFIAFVVGFYMQNFGYLGISTKQEVWAQFGDFVGGTLNPILAFFAFIALLYTIKLQSDSLETSKNELQATREELSKSAKAQEEQSQSLALQNQSIKVQMFENTFFKLFEIYNDAYKVINKIMTNYQHQNNSSIYFPKNNSFDNIEGLIRNFKRINNSFLTYILTLLEILKYTDSKSEDKDVTLYISLIKSIIRDRYLLFYISIYCHIYPNLKILIEKYSFFEDFTIIGLYRQDEILMILSDLNDNAFGNNNDLIELVNMKR